jgi:hypothetical protein
MWGDDRSRWSGGSWLGADYVTSPFLSEPFCALGAAFVMKLIPAQGFSGQEPTDPAIALAELIFAL